jgi:CelD/BcsL family acetyltransferase involved in cellulose biosynthesis
MAAALPSASVATSIEEVERLRPVWRERRWGRVDADIDFYLAVLASRPNVVRPHVVVLSNRGGVEAMAVARVEDIALASSVGYRAVYRPTVRSITLVHGGIAGVDSEAIAEALVRELRRALRRREADVVALPALRTDHPLYVAANADSTGFLRERSGPTTHRRLSLPASLDEFLATKSGKTRESVRRYAKRFRKEYGDRLAVELLRRPEDAERLSSDLDAVAEKTYQRGLGVAFADTEEHRRLTRLGLNRGWFRAYVLYLDGAPIAFWPGYAYEGTFFIGTPGYDPAYAHHRVGQFLQAEMIEALCRDEGIEYLDYGFGDSEYKRRFGNESWEEEDVLLFAPTFKGVRVRAVRMAVASMVGVAKRALGGERAEKLKKEWRRRLAARPAAS